MKTIYQVTGGKILPVNRTDPNLLLYLPLWYSAGDIRGTTIYSYDLYRRAFVVNSSWSKRGRHLIEEFLDLTSDLDISNQNNYTIEAWASFDSINDGMSIIGFTDDPGGARWLHLYMKNDGSGDLVFSHKDDAGNEAIITASGAISAGVKYHMAVVRHSSNSFELLVDNVSVGTSSQAVGTTTLNSFFCGGEKVIIYFYLTTGYLGELLIYNRSLSYTELTNHYMATKWRHK